MSSETAFDEDPPRDIVFKVEGQFQTTSFPVLAALRAQTSSPAVYHEASLPHQRLGCGLTVERTA